MTGLNRWLKPENSIDYWLSAISFLWAVYISCSAKLSRKKNYGPPGSDTNGL